MLEKSMSVLQEARRLYALGFAIHWLRPASKIPVEAGWTKGPRKEWSYLEKTYQEGFNVGTRLGTVLSGEGALPSETPVYLGVLDVDIKSEIAEQLSEALSAMETIKGDRTGPEVRSGRGNGSRHFYFITTKPFRTSTPFRSKDIIRVHQPSKNPSKEELQTLTKEEIDSGLRFSPAWEVSLYSEGRQVVLPPSIHPDTGNTYEWIHPITRIEDLPLLDLKDFLKTETPSKEDGLLEDFEVSPVDLEWLPISEEVLEAICHGKGVLDRSGYLLRASTALISAGLTENEVLTVLTDPHTFLGSVGYEHTHSRSRKAAARWVQRYTLKKVVKERSPESVFEILPAASKKLSKEEEKAQAEDIEEERHWRQGLVCGQGGIPQKLIQNVVLILTQEVGKDIIRRDEFAYRDSYGHDTPWGPKKNAVITDDDIHLIRYWLGRNFRFEPPENVVSSALVVIAQQNSFDPVKDLLEGLPAWDKTPRLDRWLIENFEAKGDPEYLAQVFRKWMCAMVMRVYQPGAKFDWMPIFEGEQGMGKSSFGRLLVGDRYFLDWLPNLNDKDAALSLQGMWGVEMGELSQFRRNELENIKAFVTRTIDKMRPPYGRRLIESPRRCVFFGTTNKSNYLADETGNRRFKPIVIGQLNFKALERDKEQLFAEAKWLFDQKIESERTMELTGSAALFERQIHQEKTVHDDSNSMEEVMKEFLEKVERKEAVLDLEKFRIIELFEGGGPFMAWKKDNRNMQMVGKMLKRIGAEGRLIQGRKHWRLGEQNFW